MKKLLVLVLALCLLIPAAAVMAEDDEEISFYTEEVPEAAAYVSTWVAEDGDWRIEFFDEDGGIKLMVVHRLGDNQEDVWEYAAALNEEKTALVSMPLGLHYRQDTVTNDWVETYYEDGGLEFLKIGNFYGGRWMKGDTEVIFYDWYEGQYDIRLYQRGADGAILKDAILKGDYDPETDSIAAEGTFGEDSVAITFSYDEQRNVVWTENGESTVLEYSYLTD